MALSQIFFRSSCTNIFISKHFIGTNVMHIISISCRIVWFRLAWNLFIHCCQISFKYLPTWVEFHFLGSFLKMPCWLDFLPKTQIKPVIMPGSASEVTFLARKCSNTEQFKSKGSQFFRNHPIPEDRQNRVEMAGLKLGSFCSENTSLATIPCSLVITLSVSSDR